MDLRENTILINSDSLSEESEDEKHCKRSRRDYLQSNLSLVRSRSRSPSYNSGNNHRRNKERNTTSSSIRDRSRSRSLSVNRGHRLTRNGERNNRRTLSLASGRSRSRSPSYHKRGFDTRRNQEHHTRACSTYGSYGPDRGRQRHRRRDNRFRGRRHFPYRRPGQRQTTSLIDELRDLLKEGSSEIMATIGGNMYTFKNLFNRARDSDSASECSMLLLLLTVVAKGFRSKSTNAFLDKAIDILEETGFITYVIINIDNNKSSLEHATLQIAVQNILSILINVRKRYSGWKHYLKRVHDTLKKLVDFIVQVELDSTNEKLQESSQFDLCPGPSDIQDLFSTFSNHVRNQGNESNEGEHFTETSIIPRPCDIERASFLKLKKNKISGPYLSVDEYLDTHFHLIREDFMTNLREGIKTFRQQEKSNARQKISGIRIYRQVRIISESCSNEGISYIVCIDNQQTKKRNPRSSDKLKGGSLVALSKDTFETYHFATVCNSDPRRIAGKIEVIFENTQCEDIKELLDCDLVMIEPTAYFKAYRHVLEVMQKYGDDDIDMPFKEYIVGCKRNIQYPKYLSNDTVYDLAGIGSLPAKDRSWTADMLPSMETETFSVSSHGSRIDDCLDSSDNELTELVGRNMEGNRSGSWNVNVLEQQWPAASEFKFDLSQLKAFHTALTKEFAVIQGPPGCGKTFIGLQIVKALLQNKQLIDGFQRRPIMIVCYTNHALDQFLEGILKFCKGQLVRIGSRSKSEKLQNFTLAKQRQKNMKVQQVNRTSVIRSRRVALNDKFSWKKTIDKYSQKIKTIKENIVNVRSLAEFIGPFCNQFHWLQQFYNDVDGNNTMLVWLGLENDASYTMVYNDGDLADDKEEIKEFRNKHIALNVNSIQDRPTKMRIARHLKDTNVLSNEDISWNTTIIVPGFPLEERWKLYRGWIRKYCHKLYEETQTNFDGYEAACQRLKEANMLSDKHTLLDCEVIGITTTGAAMHWNLLQEIRPKIVIAEEAAEVFESHLLASLTPDCEHLVLIGDHKQLRPKPEVHRLETHYNIHISMFERMVKNNIQCETLQIQHRMRPEIADNIRFIYEDLQDAEKVKLYDNVKGIKRNVYWIEHEHFEDEDGDITNHSNKHEGDFLIALCNYLLLQGYEPSQITILTLYKGQMFDIRKNITQLRTHNIERVRVDVVDNYQGEENDIILLSLVRSNSNGVIGFIKEENRICVALSRAKQGFYIVGNSKTFCKRNKEWREIFARMSKQNEIAKHLTLICQNHPDQEISVSTAGDFRKSPSGGCSKQCETILKCGHRCVEYCHFIDKEHIRSKCNEPCKWMCRNGHQCKKRCYERCEENCKELVPSLNEFCGHLKDINCYLSHTPFSCSSRCDIVMPCKHTCEKRCCDPCQPCCHKIEYKRDCGHIGLRKCHQAENYNNCEQLIIHTREPCGHTENIPCYRKYTPCECLVPYTRACGHSDVRKCSGEECGPCQKKVTYVRKSCGHPQTKHCHETENETICMDICGLTLDCGHRCQEMCGEGGNESKMQYTDKCVDAFGHTRTSVISTCLNGHVNDCNQKCDTVLDCNHKCTGTCSKCRKGVYHVPCREKCGCTLNCGHSCKGECGQCQPCNSRCERRCSHHGNCLKSCDKVCEPCQFPCLWKCEHYTCTQRCGDICNRPRCEEPCKLKLSCGHSCMGMCGDPCPCVCFKCNSNDAAVSEHKSLSHRYVQLQDCGDIIRVDIMDKYMDLEEEGVYFKSCPLCATTIRNGGRNRYEGAINATWCRINEIDTSQFSNAVVDAIKTVSDQDTGHLFKNPIVRKVPSANESVVKLTQENIDILNRLRIYKYLQTEFKLNSKFDCLNKLSISSRQSLHEVEKELHRSLDCEYLMNGISNITDDDLDTKEDELVAASDILDSHGPYVAETRLDFKAFLDSALGDTYRSVELVNIRLEYIELTFQSEAEIAKILSQDFGSRDVKGIHVINLLRWTGRPYVQCRTSKMPDAVLDEFQTNLNKIGLFFKDCPKPNQRRKRSANSKGHDEVARKKIREDVQSERHNTKQTPSLPVRDLKRKLETTSSSNESDKKKSKHAREEISCKIPISSNKQNVHEHGNKKVPRQLITGPDTVLTKSNEMASVNKDNKSEVKKLGTNNSSHSRTEGHKMERNLDKDFIENLRARVRQETKIERKFQIKKITGPDASQSIMSGVILPQHKTEYQNVTSNTGEDNHGSDVMQESKVQNYDRGKVQLNRITGPDSCQSNTSNLVLSQHKTEHQTHKSSLDKDLDDYNIRRNRSTNGHSFTERRRGVYNSTEHGERLSVDMNGKHIKNGRAVCTADNTPCIEKVGLSNLSKSDLRHSLPGSVAGKLKLESSKVETLSVGDLRYSIGNATNKQSTRPAGSTHNQMSTDKRTIMFDTAKHGKGHGKVSSDDLRSHIWSKSLDEDGKISRPLNQFEDDLFDVEQYIVLDEI